jgi:hypothetical protein
LSAAPARRYMARAAPANGSSSAAATNSTGTRRRGIACQTLTAPNAPGPDRLTTPDTGGRIRVAADSTAVAPIDEPTSTIPDCPRPRTTPTSTAPAGVRNRNGRADPASPRHGLPSGAVDDVARLGACVVWPGLWHAPASSARLTSSPARLCFPIRPMPTTMTGVVSLDWASSRPDRPGGRPTDHSGQFERATGPEQGVAAVTLGNELLGDHR